MDIHNSIMVIHNSIIDIPKGTKPHNYGYPWLIIDIYHWFTDIHKLIMDIRNSIMAINNWIMDIPQSIMDIHD